jgi:hypothetical protein
MPTGLLVRLDDFARGYDLVERIACVLGGVLKRNGGWLAALYVCIWLLAFVGLSGSYDRYLAWKYSAATVAVHLGNADSSTQIDLPSGTAVSTTMGRIAAARVVSERSGRVVRRLLIASGLAAVLWVSCVVGGVVLVMKLGGRLRERTMEVCAGQEREPPLLLPGPPQYLKRIGGPLERRPEPMRTETPTVNASVVTIDTEAIAVSSSELVSQLDLQLADPQRQPRPNLDEEDLVFGASPSTRTEPRKVSGTSAKRRSA